MKKSRLEFMASLILDELYKTKYMAVFSIIIGFIYVLTACIPLFLGYFSIMNKDISLGIIDSSFIVGNAFIGSLIVIALKWIICSIISINEHQQKP